MSRPGRNYARSFYGATIDRIVPAKGVDRRVYFTDARGTANALMRPSANPEHVREGETCDVIRNGNGRILMLRRPDPEETA